MAAKAAKSAAPSASISKGKGGWAKARKSGGKFMSSFTGFSFGLIGVLLIAIPLFNFIWVKNGGTSTLLKPYCVDSSGAAIACVVLEGTPHETSYDLFYFDVFGYLSSLVRPFDAMWDGVVDTFSDFGRALPSAGFFQTLVNSIILIINVFWTILKFVLFMPLMLIASLFQAFMAPWVSEDGWIIKCMAFHIDYIGEGPVGTAVNVVWDWITDPWKYVFG